MDVTMHFFNLWERMDIHHTNQSFNPISTPNIFYRRNPYLQSSPKAYLCDRSRSRYIHAEWARVSCSIPALAAATPRVQEPGVSVAVCVREGGGGEESTQQ